jgi:DNA (cytosine-5)-methyltransferase 1
MQRNDYKVLSLFSGGGFLDLGFIQQNFSIVEAVEIEPWFKVGYTHGITSFIEKQNLPSSLPILSEGMDLSDEACRKGLISRHKGVGGIIGGPPCQDFSIGGRNDGVTGARGKLLHAYIHLVQEILPKFIFFENVPGLTNRTHNPAFQGLLKELGEKYYITYKISNVLNYGFPQDRPRLTLVGFRKNLFMQEPEHFPHGKAGDFPHDDANLFNWPQEIFRAPKKEVEWPTQWEFKSRPRSISPENIPDRYHCLQVAEAFRGVESLPNQDEYFTPYSGKFNTVPEGDTTKKSFKRLHRFRYSPTVAYGNNEVHLHPTEARRLTVREALRLQTVPDEYELPREMPLSRKFKLIGNGVPSAKAQLISAEIRRTLGLLAND